MDQPKLDMTEVTRNLAKLRANAPAVAERAGDLWVEAVLAEASSQQNIPIATGFLQGSATVVKRGKFAWLFGFNATYAAAVHERHQTKPKFLLNAITGHGKQIFRKVVAIAQREKGGLK